MLNIAHMEFILLDNSKQWIQICGGYCTILNDEFHEIYNNNTMQAKQYCELLLALKEECKRFLCIHSINHICIIYGTFMTLNKLNFINANE